MNWKFTLIVGFIVGIVTGYYFNTFDGKNAREWATAAKVKDDTINSQKKNTAFIIAELDKAAEYLRPFYANDPKAKFLIENSVIPQYPPPISITPTQPPVLNTPTAKPQSSTQQRPVWCESTIEAENISYKAMNYSQAAINEIIRRDHPECVY